MNTTIIYIDNNLFFSLNDKKKLKLLNNFFYEIISFNFFFINDNDQTSCCFHYQRTISFKIEYFKMTNKTGLVIIIFKNTKIISYLSFIYLNRFDRSRRNWL